MKNIYFHNLPITARKDEFL